MTPSDIAVITKVMGPVMREYTAKAVADERASWQAKTAELEQRNAVLEQRVLEIETRPDPKEGPAGQPGQKGDSGVGIASLVISAEGRMVAHLTDGRSVDAGPVPQGMKGDTGERGERGEMGPAGACGVTGPQGDIGPAGAKGLDGKDGAAGRDGIDGKDGRDGIDGKDGAAGLAGKDGRDGIDGKDGAAGLNGKDGAPGPAGDRGLIGEKGMDGVPGRDGRDGAQGLPGLQGEKGINGKDGHDGLNGKDGLDGLGFDDFDLYLDETKGWLLRLGQGDRVKEWELGIPFDSKAWQAGSVYPKGAGVTWDGGYWIALTKTHEQPGEGSPNWRLAVRRGKQGREGKQGKDGSPGKDLTQMDPATGRKW